MTVTGFLSTLSVQVRQVNMSELLALSDTSGTLNKITFYSGYLVQTKKFLKCHNYLNKYWRVRWTHHFMLCFYKTFYIHHTDDLIDKIYPQFHFTHARDSVFSGSQLCCL